MNENFEAITDLQNRTETTSASGVTSHTVDNARRSTPDLNKPRVRFRKKGSMAAGQSVSWTFGLG